MTEEMKLLRALCEALGFDVVVNRDFKERQEPKRSAKFINENILGERRITVRNGAYVLDKDGMYTSRLVEPETSYTLTMQSAVKQAARKSHD